MDHLYVPTFSAEQRVLEDEVELVKMLSASLDTMDPLYNNHKEYYDRMLDNLHVRLAQADSRPDHYSPSFPSSSTLTPSPGRHFASGSGSVSASGSGSGSGYDTAGSARKRSLELSDSKAPSLCNTPGGTPRTPAALQGPTDPGYRRDETGLYRMDNYVDLTGSDVDDTPFPNHTTPLFDGSRLSDPFPELFNAYQPGANQPVDTFNQEWMDTEELAQYLMTPTPAEGMYTANLTENLSWTTESQSAHHRLFTAPTSDLDLDGNPSDEDQLRTSDAGPEAVQDLIENIRGHDDLPPELREPTPKAMSSNLMEHQKIALTWLLKMERGKSKGAILADEMGLGKTVEALSLILANPSTNPACKTTLIVAPVALMRQWEKEIERHVKPHHRLDVFVYHGYGKKADFDKLRTFDIVLTTFGTLSSEMKQKELRKEAEAAQRERQDARYVRPARESLALLGRKSMWYRVILDEAQCIKTRTTQVSKAANELQSQLRLAMTGTPMMNGVDELFPLVRFLKIPPYHDWGRFSFEISKPLKKNSERLETLAMNRVQALLKSIMLRRGKKSIVDGKEICEIPRKHIIQQHVRFSGEEVELYKAIETNSQLKFNRYLERGTVNNNYAHVLVMLLRLRQICCHPKLVKDLGVQVSTEGIAEDDLLQRAGLLGGDVVKRLLAAEAFECPICYEADANPTIIIPCGHATCGECFQKLIDPSRGIREGNESASARCPHCRGVLSSDNITDYEHFCKVHCPEKLEEYKNDLPGGPYSDSDLESDSASDWDSSNEDEDGSLKDFVVPDSDAEMNDEIDEAGQEPVPENGVARKKHTKKGKGKAPPKPTLTLAQLKKESLRNKDAKRRYLKRLRKSFTSSAKINKTLELLSEIRAADPTEKTLVFSQWTGLLDLLEVPLSERKFKYQRYDGSMPLNDRAGVVNQFMDNAEENIMLVSLKAGNAGLNLSKASQVIILDPFWNPFIEEQAIDRAHRMPQKREVHVHRILVPETVEDRICALQDKKREIVNTALDEGVGKSLSRLSVGELRFLFGLGAHG